MIPPPAWPGWSFGENSSRSNDKLGRIIPNGSRGRLGVEPIGGIKLLWPPEYRRGKNMSLALQTSLALQGGEMHTVGRADSLARYRRFRDLRTDIQTEALKHIPRSSFLAHAKRIGLSDGKALFSDDDVELTLVFDLALHTAKAGRTRAIDRFARMRRTASDADEALVLAGLQAARFSIFRVTDRYEPAGLLIEDLLRGFALWLLDEGLEQSASPGSIFAMRVAPIEDFAVTCGVIVPVGDLIFNAIDDFLIDCATDSERAALADDPRFATSLYQLAVELGLMSLVAYR